MSDLLTVRTLIADPPQYGVSTQAADGTNVEFVTPNTPIIPGSAKVYVAGVLQTLGSDYTIDESIGLITFGTAPGSGLEVTISITYSILSDDQLQSMLDLNVDSLDPVRLAAADCLDIIASSEVLIQKKIKLLDLQTDGPAEAKELRAHAKSLRDLVYSPDYEEPSLDIIEQINDTAGWKEKIVKDWMREGF